MDFFRDIQLDAVKISLAALTVSVFSSLTSFLTFWFNHLSAFKVKALHDDPTFVFYKITPQMSGDIEARSWWIPSFDLGISFYNLGKRIGIIEDIRITATIKDSGKERTIKLSPKWIVDYAKFQNIRTERFKWIEQSVLRDWYPMLLNGNGNVSLHVILEERRFDTPILGEMDYKLEIKTSGKNKWILLDEYNLRLTEDMYESKSSISTSGLRKLKKAQKEFFE